MKNLSLKKQKRKYIVRAAYMPDVALAPPSFFRKISSCNEKKCIICNGKRSIGSEWYCRKCFRENGIKKGIRPTIMYEIETCSDNSNWYFANDKTLTRLHGDKLAFRKLDYNDKWPDYPL